MALLRLVAPAGLAGCVVAGLVAGGGCSLVLATDGEQCNTTADCTSRGASFAGTVCTDDVCTVPAPAPDPAWGCIGHVATPATTGMVTYRAQLLDLITGDPVTKGLSVELCNKYDPQCAMPLMSTAPDGTGWITATVAPDFEGYFEIADATGTYLPTLLFMDLVAGPENTDVLLISHTVEGGLASTAGVTVDPSDGLVLVRTANCTGDRTEGVTVSLSPSGKQTGFYLINNAPVISATQTDASGNAGFANVTPGTVVVTGTVAATHEALGQVSTLVRAGYMTYQTLRPTPTP